MFRQSKKIKMNSQFDAQIDKILNSKEAVMSLGSLYSEKVLRHAQREFKDNSNAQKYYDWKKIYEIINDAIADNEPIILEQRKLATFYLQELLQNVTLQRIINISGQCRHCGNVFIVAYKLLMCKQNVKREFNNLCDECRCDKEEVYRKQCHECGHWHLRKEC